MQESHKSMVRMESALQEKEANSMCAASFARALGTEKPCRHALPADPLVWSERVRGLSSAHAKKFSEASILPFDAQGVADQGGPYAA